LLNHLSSKHIYVSAGSACNSKNKTKSHVLEAIKVNKEYIDGAIRISFGYNNSEEDIDCFINEIVNILPLLQRIRRK